MDKMEKKDIKYGLLGGLFEVVYIVLIGLFFFGAGQWFSSDNNILISIIFLIIFVISAAVSGFFVFGWPIYLVVKEKDFKRGVKVFSLSLGVIVFSLLLFLFIYFIIN